MNHAHAPSATSHGGFYHHRIANLSSSFVRRVGGFHWLSSARQHGNARRSSQPSRRRFITQQLEELRGRSNKFNRRLFASTRKSRILRKKSIAGMDSVSFF